MNPPKCILWGPEQEALLKSLRVSAGHDIATVARHNFVSTVQVRQLEDGGHSSFYSPEIKFSVGKKLLKYLGHELKDVPAPKAQEPQVAPEAQEALATTSNMAAHKALVAPLHEPTANLTASSSNSLALPFLLSGVVLIVALWFWLSNERVTSLPPVVSTPPELKPETKSEVLALQAENASAPLPATSIQPELPKPVALSACNWNNTEAEIRPDSPKKAGEYVHVVALQASTVCIMDGLKRVATLNLQVGEARSIYGPSPFKIYSADLNVVKVYFQGQYIKLPSQDMTQIKLTPSPDFALKN